MTSPDDWTAAEAARLRRIGEDRYCNYVDAKLYCVLDKGHAGEHLGYQSHDYDCDCAACLLERFVRLCEGEVDAT